MALLYFLSDTHHELISDQASQDINIFPPPPEEGGARYLALCGDIGCPFDAKYQDFIARHAERFDQVFLVAGNHEYYGTRKKQYTMAEVDAQIHAVSAQFHNVHYLQKSTYTTEDGITFAGCTLWTQPHPQADSVLRDFSHIHVDADNAQPGRLVKTPMTLNGQSSRVFMRPGRRFIRPDDVAHLHHDMRQWLKGVIATVPEGEKLVILTHHAPSVQMLRPFPDNLSMEATVREELTRPSYASNCDDLFRPPVVAWISGHTHRCVRVDINDIPSLSNCWGYADEETGVNLNTFIEL
jgi:predicted MPP superfamily phosphohydrolase